MENASGSARAIDQKGLHFPGKAQDPVGGEGRIISAEAVGELDG